jgi:hypothetical protein
MSEWDFPGYADALALVLLFSGLFLILKKKKGELSFKNYPNWFLPALIFFHYTISALSIYYVITFGGDSVKYWALTADLSQNASTWMEYWGYNTFFIQWLNYLPSKVLGLHYLTGCLIYSTLSLIGFIWLVEVVSPLYLSAVRQSRFFAVSMLLIFFLPGPHFWTGLVSKEAFIWFCLVLLLKSTVNSRVVLYFLAVALLVWVRPVLGLLAMGISSVYWLTLVRIPTGKIWLLVSLLIVSGFLGMCLLMYITGISSVSINSISDFSLYQYRFLKEFNPDTLVPMEEYSMIYRLLTVGFRPFPSEIPTLWGSIVGMENLILGLLTLGIIPTFIHSFGQRKKFLLIMVMIIGIILFLMSIALTVNVLGIMIRLKSPLVPFLALTGWNGWFLLFNQRKKTEDSLNL